LLIIDSHSESAFGSDNDWCATSAWTHKYLSGQRRYAHAEQCTLQLLYTDGCFVWPWMYSRRAEFVRVGIRTPLARSASLQLLFGARAGIAVVSPKSAFIEPHGRRECVRSSDEILTTPSCAGVCGCPCGLFHVVPPVTSLGLRSA